jgi:putative SOS response-associated peptidase YedK
MCGRYSFAPTPKQRKEQLPMLDALEVININFNIAPTQQAYVIGSDQPRQLQLMEWGLVPFWSKDGANQGRLINARSEGIETKASFREPIHSRRCLVPADSFYEWRTAPGRRKIPYRILRHEAQLMFMAGIWDEWRQGNLVKRTFSIITTRPNKEVSDLHDRMPVLLLDPAEQETWLSQKSTPEQIMELLHPPADGLLELYRVSERLNSAGAEGAGLQERVEEELRLF